MSKKKAKSKDLGAASPVFVISPIREAEPFVRNHVERIMNRVIEPTISEMGYKMLKADNISKPGVIANQVIEHTINAPLVIADLSGHDPNVFYELAIRQAAGKPVIHFVRKGEEIPFEVSDDTVIEVDHEDPKSIDEAKKRLRTLIEAFSVQGLTEKQIARLVTSASMETHST